MVPTTLPETDTVSSTTDSELARLLAAWPRLPTVMKAGILAMVEAVGCNDQA